MYGNELGKSGIYAIKNTLEDKIVYVGGTNITFVERWGHHLLDFRIERHCNPKLTELFKSGNYEFIILETGKFTTRELLDKEHYYINLYDVYYNGYNINVGGGRLLDETKLKKPHKILKETTNVKYAREYILENWYNKRIYKEDKLIIEEVLERCFNLKHGHFLVFLKALGFTAQSYADKRSWIITGTKFARYKNGERI